MNHPINQRWNELGRTRRSKLPEEGSVEASDEAEQLELKHDEHLHQTVNRVRYQVGEGQPLSSTTLAHRQRDLEEELVELVGQIVLVAVAPDPAGRVEVAVA